LGWEKQKEEEAKEEKKEKNEEKEQAKKKNQRKGKNMQINKVVKEWDIWDEEEEVAKLEEETKKLVSKQFNRWIKVFGKKASKRMLTRKAWNHAIDLKEEFIPRKEKVYLLLREEREFI